MLSEEEQVRLELGQMQRQADVTTNEVRMLLSTFCLKNIHNQV